MNELQELQNLHDLGRAKNAVQEFLIHKLLIPKIYLDANWNGGHVNVLAVDRAGVGDVHAVWILNSDTGKSENAADSLALLSDLAVTRHIEKLKQASAHYRYLAFVGNSAGTQDFYLPKATADQCLAEDGVGRIGVLLINLGAEAPAVQILLKPERFRSSKELVELADQFVAEHTPNWEVRE